MQNQKRSSSLTIRHKAILAQVALILIILLIAQWNGWIALLAGIAGSFLIGRGFARRIRRALEVSQAWLRGSLALRISDPQGDELGQLANQLDLLVEHLEEDEEDLEALRERNARLTDQVRALAVVEERNRLARELHDSVKQHLFSLAMTASAIRTRFDSMPDVSEDLQEMAREIETAAQHAQRETTRLIEDLRPGSLQEQGLVQALNDYSLLFGAQEHILVYLDVQGGDKHLPPAVAEALYRVTQEALHNIARHAQATRVDVNLISLPERVELTIEDNGVGFDPNGTRQGLGLTNMQERLMTVGGKLTVESQPGIGTKVTAEVALPYLPTMLTAMTAARRERPSLSVSNWAWLGQRLVIPVGQTWPWLPADQRHLRDPLIDPDDTPVRVQEHKGLLQLRKEYRLQPTVAIAPLARLQQSGAGYEWHINSERWTLQRIRGRAGRMVLNRNNQPLAAMQYQGRQMHVWTEIVYDDRAYRLVSCKEGECAMLLEDDSGEILIEIRQKNGLTLTLKRPLPLPFLVIVAVRVIDERVRGSLMIETEG